MSRILLIDDDTLTTKLYKGKFEDGGFEIDTAPDGETGLKMIRDKKPDVILLDIMMPKMDGLEVLRKLKKSSSTQKIPIILLTNVGDSEDDVEKGLELGAVTYLIKSSYTPKEVLLKTKEIMEAYVQDSKKIPTVEVKIKKESFTTEKGKK